MRMIMNIYKDEYSCLSANSYAFQQETTYCTFTIRNHTPPVIELVSRFLQNGLAYSIDEGKSTTFCRYDGQPVSRFKMYYLKESYHMIQ